MKQEALKLADDLDNLHEQDKIDGVAHLSMPMAAEMIRKLVVELDRVEDIRNYYAEEQGKFSKPYTAPRELSDDEIITRYREIMSRSSV